MSVLLNFILIYLINKTDINSQLTAPVWLFLPKNNEYGLYFIVPWSGNFSLYQLTVMK